MITTIYTTGLHSKSIWKINIIPDINIVVSISFIYNYYYILLLFAKIIAISYVLFVFDT